MQRAIAKVECLETDILGGRHDAGHNIVDVRKIPLLSPIAPNGNRPAGCNAPAKLQHAHVGAPHGSVHREKPNDRHINSVQMMIRISQYFGGLFGSGIGGQRARSVVIFFEWNLRDASIEARSRSEHEFLNA